jgi:hypothetical protein
MACSCSNKNQDSEYRFKNRKKFSINLVEQTLQKISGFIGIKNCAAPSGNTKKANCIKKQSHNWLLEGLKVVTSIDRKQNGKNMLFIHYTVILKYF